MELDEALSLIEYAFAQHEDELLFQRWIVSHQTEMSFEEFKQKLKPPVLKDEAEILNDVESILDAFGGEK